MSGSIFMAWLSMAALAAASMLSGSTRLRSWLRGACRRLRRPGCWPDGSGARRGRPAGMWIRRRHRAGSRSRKPRWCSRSRCRPGSRALSGSMPGCRGARSPPWSHKRWRSFSLGAAETIPAGERPGGRGGVCLRPPPRAGRACRCVRHARTWPGALATTQRNNDQFRRLWKPSSDGGAAGHDGGYCPTRLQWWSYWPRGGTTMAGHRKARAGALPAAASCRQARARDRTWAAWTLAGPSLLPRCGRDGPGREVA